MANRRCTIIIVKYKNPDYEGETVRQVTRTTRGSYDLIVHENYDKDENLSTVWNNLIRNATTDYICLLNNDTVPSDGWLDNLLSTFDEIQNLGAVGPISNHAGGHQGGHKGPLNTGAQECKMLSGFCLVFPKKVWEELDGFNEAYKLYGEDSDFCTRLSKKYKLATRYDTHIYHHGASSKHIAEERGKDIDGIRKESARLYQNSL